MSSSITAASREISPYHNEIMVPVPNAAADILSIEERVAGPHIANLFKQQAAKILSNPEMTQLLQFIEHPKSPHVQATQDVLHRTLMRKLKHFRSKECQVSSENPARLATPGGPEDADLGIILHIQSEDDVIDRF